MNILSYDMEPISWTIYGLQRSIPPIWVISFLLAIVGSRELKYVNYLKLILRFNFK